MNRTLSESPTPRSETNWVTPLHCADNPDEYGAKACRLAEMQRLGFSVPDGLVISGLLFNQTVQQPQLRTFIESHLCDLNVGDLTQIANAASAIATRIATIRLPESFLEDLNNMASSMLDQGPVAVRSSACGEDSEDAAFAGQLDTFLGIKTLPSLHEAILKCWASYWSHRVIAYQLSRDIHLKSMGVIIQQQVDAKYSGVLFTRNVQSPDADQLVLESCEGLGEQLVSGHITPSCLVTDSNGNPVDSIPAVATKADPQTKVESQIPSKTVQQLVKTGRELESHFSHPQDIEWSMDQADAIQILQSRPITTISKPGRCVTWSNANVNENFPDPICPLLYSIAADGYYHYFRNMALAFGVAQSRIDTMEHPLRNIIGTHGGRMYYNLSNIHAVLRAVPFGEFLADAFNQFVGSESTTRDRRVPSWKSLSRSRLAEFRELITITKKAGRRFRHLEAGVARFEATVDEFAADSDPANLQNLDSQQLLSLWRRFLNIRSHWTDAAMADAASMIYYRLTGMFLSREFTSEEEQAMVNRLLSGLCDIVSGLPTEKLWDLSRKIRASERLSRSFTNRTPEEIWKQIQQDESLSDIHLDLQTFLDNWGFRCSGELMLTTASYQEVPSSLMPVLASFVELEGPSPREHLETQQERRRTTTETILKELEKKWLHSLLPYPRKSHVASWLLRRTQRSVACRERARLKQALLYSRLRRIALAIGEHLTKDRYLTRNDDIFFLTHREVEDLLCGASMLPGSTDKLTDLRRAELEELGKFQPPDRLELPAGKYWQPIDSSDNNNQRGGQWNEGMGVSGGKIVGRAVVLTSPDQFAKVSKGDILVTRQTDPGWGPILFLVRGLVMERGGMLSHGAILAREYGIPTVVGIDDATQRINTGDTIEIDGDRGRVDVLS